MSMGVAGADVQFADGVVVYRASALGGCTKALIHARVGDEGMVTDMTGERASKVQSAMDKGTALEEDILARYHTEHGEWIDKWETGDIRVDLPLFGNIVVRGHCDAIAYIPNPEVKGQKQWMKKVVEAKSCGQREWDQWLAAHQASKGEYAGMFKTGFFPRYRWQISVYVLGIGAVGAHLVVRNRDTGEQFTVWCGMSDLYNKADILKRVMGIEAAAKTMSVPVDCDVPGFPCPYFQHHSASAREEIEGMMEVSGPAEVVGLKEDPMLVQRSTVISALAKVYVEALQAEKNAAEEKKAAYEKLREVLDVGQFTVSDEVHGTYDVTKFRLKSWDDEMVESYLREKGEDVEEFKATGVRVTEK